LLSQLQNQSLENGTINAIPPEVVTKKMAYNFRNEKIDDKNRKRIEATCDKCHVVNFVRRDWAATKVRNNGVQSTEYYCAVCSGRRNISKAREKKMNDELITEFIALCEAVFSNLWDDKSERYIGDKIGSTAFGLIRNARDFVHDYLYTGVSGDIYDCAEYIGIGADQEILDLYPWETEMYARALIHLEQLPRPDGI
jgi:hypothetical protein